MSIKNIFTFIFFIYPQNTITTQNAIPVKNNNNFFLSETMFYTQISNTVLKLIYKVKLLPLFNF